MLLSSFLFAYHVCSVNAFWRMAIPNVRSNHFLMSQYSDIRARGLDWSLRELT